MQLLSSPQLDEWETLATLQWETTIKRKEKKKTLREQK